MNSLAPFWDAVRAFGASLGSVGWFSVALALSFHFASQMLRAMAWRNIIAVALDEDATPLAPIAGGLLAGVGLNGVVPARVGDATKLFLVHRRLPKASYPMLTSSLVPEALFNAVMASVLLVWTASSGRLPGGIDLPEISAFEISWAARYPFGTALCVALLSGAILALVGALRSRIAVRWHELRSGVRILRTPRRYLGSVVTFQAAAWLVRVGAAWFFLRAFGIDATPENALLVVMIQGAGSLFTLTPGGVGPKQALTVAIFAGQASSSTILAFSAGMELIVVTFQALIGFAVAIRMMDGWSVREMFARAAVEGRHDEPGPIGPGAARTSDPG